jgi:hypothetical protein
VAVDTLHATGIVRSTPRSAARLLDELTAARPKNPFAEGVMTITSPDEMETLARTYLNKAPELMRGMTPHQARTIAMRDMRHWAGHGYAVPGTEREWKLLLNALSWTRGLKP